MIFEVFMQVWCLQKSKLWWKQGKTGEKSQNRAIHTTPFRQLLGTFQSLPEVHFMRTISCFEAREVRITTLQTVSKSEFKRKIYGHCKKTAPSWTKNSHRANQGAKIFAPCETLSCTRVAFRTPQANFRTVRNKVRKFRTPLFKVRNSFQGAKISVQGASISHTTIQGANFIPTCEFECENFATVGHNFEELPGAQIMHIIYLFKAWEVRNPVLQTVCDLNLKRRSYGRLKMTMQS